MGRREAEHETETAPADRHPDLPATGRRAVKPRPPQSTGGRQPWDGGKRNMKPRPPLLRRKRRLWTFLVRPGRSRFHSAPETARPGRPRFQPAPKTARQGRPRFQPAPKTARQGRSGFHTQLLEQRSGRAGADATAALGRAVGTRPADPSPGVPIALEAHCPLVPSVDELSHSPGMHTSLTPHGAARSSSRRIEVLILARLLDTPQEDQGAHAERPGACLPPPGRIHTLGD